MIATISDPIPTHGHPAPR